MIGSLGEDIAHGLQRNVRRAQTAIGIGRQLAQASPTIARSFFSTAPVVGISPLFDTRHYIFLLFALAETGPLALSFRDVALAKALLPAELFEKSIRISQSNYVTLGKGSRGRKTVEVDERYFQSTVHNSSYKMPYFAHPIFYTQRLYKQLSLLREGERRVRIFFAGTINSEVYTRSFQFPIMSRAEIFSTIFARFSSQIGSLTDLTKQIIISQTDEGADNLVKHPLSPDQYLAAIASADFFICPPGWVMPHSHNLVEAMSVGAIPITNYSDYIVPALADNVNSLQFHDAESLCEAIDVALRMPVRRVREMREQAQLYYDEVLSHLAVGTKIRESLLTLDKIIANSERLFDLFPKPSTV